MGKHIDYNVCLYAYFRLSTTWDRDIAKLDSEFGTDSAEIFIGSRDEVNILTGRRYPFSPFTGREYIYICMYIFICIAPPYPSRRVLRGSTYDPGHWTFYFCRMGFGLVVSAVLPYARGRGFDSQSRLVRYHVGEWDYACFCFDEDCFWRNKALFPPNAICGLSHGFHMHWDLANGSSSKLLAWVRMMHVEVVRQIANRLVSTLF
jgi:hypothetical protein